MFKHSCFWVSCETGAFPPHIFKPVFLFKPCAWIYTYSISSLHLLFFSQRGDNSRTKWWLGNIGIISLHLIKIPYRARCFREVSHILEPRKVILSFANAKLKMWTEKSFCPQKKHVPYFISIWLGGVREQINGTYLSCKNNPKITE